MANTRSTQKQRGTTRGGMCCDLYEGGKNAEEIAAEKKRVEDARKSRAIASMEGKKASELEAEKQRRAREKKEAEDAVIRARLVAEAAAREAKREADIAERNEKARMELKADRGRYELSLKMRADNAKYFLKHKDLYTTDRDYDIQLADAHRAIAEYNHYNRIDLPPVATAAPTARSLGLTLPFIEGEVRQVPPGYEPDSYMSRAERRMIPRKDEMIRAAIQLGKP